MHDLDRTLRTDEPEIDLDGEAWEIGDDESELVGLDELAGESELDDEWETDEETGDGGALSEEEEMDLAAELLTVSDEAELDLFLGKLIRRVGRRVKKFARPLGKLIKPLAKKLLPIAGGAVGTFFGGPAGAALGGKLGSLATRLFEVDFESMDPEEQEMEVARRVVRLTASAAQRAAAAPPSADPVRVARAAVASAAKRHAPGLVRRRRPTGHGACSCGRTSGRWVRRGQRIVILGA